MNITQKMKVIRGSRSTPKYPKGYAYFVIEGKTIEKMNAEELQGYIMYLTKCKMELSKGDGNTVIHREHNKFNETFECEPLVCDCPFCQGTGQATIEIEKEWIECPNCVKGVIKKYQSPAYGKKCLLCDGKGKIPKYKVGQIIIPEYCDLHSIRRRLSRSGYCQDCGKEIGREIQRFRYDYTVDYTER